MKIVKEEGGNSIIAIAQTEEEIRFLYQLEKGVTTIRADLGSIVRLRIMPSLDAMVAPKVADYASMTADDLSTKAATLGIDVSKGSARDDLIKVLEAAKTDLERAKEMAKLARPAKQVKPFQLTPGGRNGDVGVNTVNHV